MKENNTITFNYSKEDIIKEEHICYYAKKDDFIENKWYLVEVYRETVKHPQAPEHAILYNINTRAVRSTFITNNNVADIMLLNYAQLNCKEITNMFGID